MIIMLHPLSLHQVFLVALGMSMQLKEIFVIVLTLLPSYVPNLAGNIRIFWA
jgi:hypothetical protein